MPSAIAKLRGRSEALDSFVSLAAMHRKYHGDLVLVYCMPKTASRSIHDAIVQHTSRPALHFHYLTEPSLQRDRAWWASQRPGEQSLGWRRGEYARARLRYTRRGRQWDVINGVREPVARSLSAFFQIGEQAGFFQLDDDSFEPDYDRLVPLFLEHYAEVDDWFRVEFEPATGIDVYASPFDRETGFQLYSNERFRHLLVRQEDIARTGASAVSRFLGAEIHELPRTNIASGKAYRAMYERFLAGLTLPEEYVERAYSTEQARHFYSSDERDALRARWIR